MPAPVDAAASHPFAFGIMAVLAVILGCARVAHETKVSIKNVGSFIHMWTFAYLALLTVLMSITTDMALVLLVGPDGKPALTFIHPSLVSMAAAVFGVFSFEITDQQVRDRFWGKQIRCFHNAAIRCGPSCGSNVQKGSRLSV